MPAKNQVSVTIEPALREYMESGIVNGKYESLSHAVNTAIRRLMREDPAAKEFVKKDLEARRSKLPGPRKAKK
jgi:Arc/MetJ-type ribon-helix-helix transcriptional regulator